MINSHFVERARVVAGRRWGEGWGHGFREWGGTRRLGKVWEREGRGGEEWRAEGRKGRDGEGRVNVEEGGGGGG